MELKLVRNLPLTRPHFPLPLSPVLVLLPKKREREREREREKRREKGGKKRAWDP